MTWTDESAGSAARHGSGLGLPAGGAGLPFLLAKLRCIGRRLAAGVSFRLSGACY